MSNKLLLIVAISLLSTFFVSCEKKVQIRELEIEEIISPMENERVVEYQKRENIVLTKAQENIVNQSNAFAINAFREVYALQANKNVCISPLSISLALSAVSCGAQGNTLSQIQNALGFSNVESVQMYEYYKYIIPELQKVDTTIDFCSANAVWVNRDFSLKTDFVSQLDKYYSSKVSKLDFSSNDAAKTINDWCKEKTKGLIPSIIDKTSKESKLMLVNALYFKGGWRVPFDKKNNKTDYFYLNNGTKESVTYMNKELVTIHYGESEDVTIGAIPYGNEAYEMVIVLPNEGISAESLLTKLDDKLWSKWMNSILPSRYDFDVKLPKFKVEYDSQDYMINAMEQLGIVDAFNSERADFNNISSDSNLYISLLKHKTFFEVDEKGTESAAATIIGMDATAGPGAQNVPNWKFEVTRPFIYAIREISTGVILFIGITTKI